MHLTTLLILLFAAPIPALPAPPQAPTLARRACTTVLPTYHRPLANYNLSSGLTHSHLALGNHNVSLGKNFFVSEDYTNSTLPSPLPHSHFRAGRNKAKNQPTQQPQLSPIV